MNAKMSKNIIHSWLEKNQDFNLEDYSLVDLMAIGYELGWEDANNIQSYGPYKNKEVKEGSTKE